MKKLLSDTSLKKIEYRNADVRQLGLSTIHICMYLFGCLEFEWWAFIDGGRVILASCDDSERP